MSVKFENPPINEVVMGVYFSEPVLDLRSQHIGLFWSKVREQFPSVEQRNPAGGIEALNVSAGEVFPMPRYWFISQDGTDLLQVQRNALLMNWRNKDTEYPGFHEHLEPKFDKCFKDFLKFIQNETSVNDLTIDLCELTYINVIERGDYWSGSADISNILPSFHALDIGKDSIPSVNCAYDYELSEDLHLRVEVKSATLTRDPSKPVLVLEIKANGKISPASHADAKAWFDRAHGEILSCLLKMTSKEIQEKHWKRVEVK